MQNTIKVLYDEFGNPLAILDLEDCNWIEKYGEWELVTENGKDYVKGQMILQGYPVTGLYLHRYIASLAANRELTKNDVVIFKDGNRLNFTRNNLKIMSRSEYARERKGKK